VIQSVFELATTIFRAKVFNILADKSLTKSMSAAPSAKEESTQAMSLTKTRQENSQEIAEDYVEAIADLIIEHGEARVVDLARRLGVTHVTVSRTITRLQKHGYVRSEPYRSIFLTETGTTLATACKVRHATVVAFLRAIGVPSRIAEHDAEGMEHHVSPETLAAFRKVIKAGKAL
jgi:DtxR family manganese transport transcriptional regulator